MTATPMPCVRTHPPPTSAPAGLATKGRAGSVRVSDLGTSSGWASRGSSLPPQLLSWPLALVKVLQQPSHPHPGSHHLLSELHVRSLKNREHQVFPRADHTVLSGSEMSFCLASAKEKCCFSIFWSHSVWEQKVSSHVDQESHACQNRADLC